MKQDADIKNKITTAISRCGKLHKFLPSPLLPIQLKLRLYESAVISLLTYGSESWDLNDKEIKQLNGANSRMLSWFTGKSIPAEARPCSTSFNVIMVIRKRRLRWVGHLLRAGPTHLGYQALQAQMNLGRPGNLLMDAPTHHSLQNLARLAEDRAYWSQLVAAFH